MSANLQDLAYQRLGTVMADYDERFGQSLTSLVDTTDDPIYRMNQKAYRLRNHLQLYAPNGGKAVIDTDIVVSFAKTVESELTRRMDMIEALRKEKGDLAAVVESLRSELKELKHPNFDPLTTRQKQQHVVVSTETEWGTIAEYCQKWGVVGANKRGTGYHKVMAATRRKTSPLKSRQEPGRPWEVDMGTYFKLNGGQ